MGTSAQWAQPNLTLKITSQPIFHNHRISTKIIIPTYYPWGKNTWHFSHDTISNMYFWSLYILLEAAYQIQKIYEIMKLFFKTNLHLWLLCFHIKYFKIYWSQSFKSLTGLIQNIKYLWSKRVLWKSETVNKMDFILESKMGTAWKPKDLLAEQGTNQREYLLCAWSPESLCWSAQLSFPWGVCHCLSAPI